MHERVSEADRIYIRRITEDDTDLIVDWRNREDVRQHFFFREPFTRQMHEKWLRDKVATGLVEQFIVCMKEDDRPVGSSYLRDIDRDEASAEYGIFIGEADARGRGLGAEILKATMDHAVNDMGLKLIRSRAISTNIASIKIFTDYGFTVNDTVRGVTCSDGNMVDMVLMSYGKR